MTYFPRPKNEEQPHQQVFHAPVPQDIDEDEDADLPLSYEEEQALARRDRWRVIAGIGDFFGVLAGILVILLFIAVLISLVNWVVADMTQSFTLLRTWF